MKKLPIIEEESLDAVQDEVSKEIDSFFVKTPNKKERIAFSAFFGTLVNMTLDSFNNLSSEEQEDILTTCSMWFNIGMLAGRSPGLLADILARTGAKIERFTPPEWFGEKDRAIAEAEEIVTTKGKNSSDK